MKAYSYIAIALFLLCAITPCAMAGSSDTFGGGPKYVSVMERTHHETHEGKYWSVSNTVTLNSASRHYLVVPASSYGDPTHITFLVRANGEANFRIYNGTVATGGELLPAVNHNFIRPNASTTAIYNTPTITSVGTLRVERHIGASRTVGESRATDEYVLLPGDKYLFSITTEAATVEVTTTFSWYEESW